MNNDWACLPTATDALEFLSEIRAWLRVRTISTLRDELIMLPKDSDFSALNRKEYDAFDFIPATEGKEIVGIFQKTDGCRKFEALRESFLVEADSSLLEFIESAPTRQFALLVDKREIVGLVTHSDLQRLPVYTALFAVISAVEMQLMAWIRNETKGNETLWLNHVKYGKEKIDNFYRDSVAQNVAIDRLSCASFGQELDAARGLKLFLPGSVEESQFKMVIDRRNEVFHGKEIALRPQRVSDISEAIVAACALTKFLHAELKRQAIGTLKQE